MPTPHPELDGSGLTVLCMTPKFPSASDRDATKVATYLLSSPTYEHDVCGVGLGVDFVGSPFRQNVEKALANLTHRDGVGDRAVLIKVGAQRRGVCSHGGGSNSPGGRGS